MKTTNYSRSWGCHGQECGALLFRAFVIVSVCLCIASFDSHTFGREQAENQKTRTPLAKADAKRVLIITGEDYKGHKWKLTTPVLKRHIENDKRLSVEVVDKLTFLRSKKLHDYDAVVMHFKNYDPKVPGREGYDNLNKFVERGGGLVLVHFCCGAFQEFKGDYVKLVGRIWDRKRRGHDPYGTFTVNITKEKHPITRGMASFKTTDELYTCLTGDTPITVLAAGVSKIDKKTHPLAFVVTSKEHRVFHCVLGHDVKALSNEGTGKLFRRGTAWTAKLKLTDKGVQP